jgi:acyl phosphate:glycerol-3-phosphate acyltransferase
LILDYALALLGGYLLGSIPFGLLLTRMAGLGDIRNVGSGNIGATNVLRTGRKDIALATVLLDAGKAALALFLVRHFFNPEAGFVAGAAAMFGHCFPVWLKFKGGKGVATFFGTLLVGLWPVGVLAGLLWLGTAFTFRFSSLAALVATLAAPLIALIFHAGTIGTLAIAAMSAMVWYRHRENLTRLLKGQEPKIGGSKA